MQWYDAVRFCRWLTEQAGRREEEQAHPDPNSLDKTKFPADPSPLANGAPQNWPVELYRNGYRLPTESEWEIGCRGQAASAYGFGNDVSLRNRYGWFLENSGKHVQLSRTLRPNLRGLFDMHGNVWELCYDWQDVGKQVVSVNQVHGTGKDTDNDISFKH